MRNEKCETEIVSVSHFSFLNFYKFYVYFSALTVTGAGDCENFSITPSLNIPK